MKTRCVIIVIEGFQILDMAGPSAVLEVAARHAGQKLSVEVVAVPAGPVRSSSGVTVMAGPLGDPATVDTLIVTAGSDDTPGLADPSIYNFIRACGSSARRVASICSGAFVLAEAGILDGHVATTHWIDAEALARSFPAVTVEPDRIYVRSGKIWTSAGVSAGIDLALAMATDDYGEEIARIAAQRLVVPLRRLGGQSQFSTLIALQRPEARFAELLHQIRADLAGDHGVEALAARTGMSPRNFARLFQAETGMSPAKAVERLRCESAQAMLHAGASVKEAARACGFGDQERMRRAFRRNFASAPAAFKYSASAG